MLLHRQKHGRYAHPRGDVVEHGLVLTTLAMIKLEPVEWLVPKYLPLGKLVLLVGQGGLGKSLLTVHLAACLSVGRPCFGLAYASPPAGESLLCALEDDYADTVVPRLAAVGADLTKVHRVDGIAGESSGWTLQHLDKLDKELAARPGIRLLVLDPVGSFLGKKVDDHRDSDVRAILDPLAALAARRKITVLAIRHLNKSEAREAARRVSGSAAYVNSARAVFLVGADPEDDSRRVLLPIKANIAEQPAGLAFRPEQLDAYRSAEVLAKYANHLDAEQKARLAQQLVGLAWLGETSLIADDVLESSGKSSSNRDVDKAAEWLHEFLRAGPQPSETCVAAGNEYLGQSYPLRFWRENVLNKKLHGGSRKPKGTMKAQWFFCLPGQSPPAEETESSQQRETVSSGKNGLYQSDVSSFSWNSCKKRVFPSPEDPVSSGNNAENGDGVLLI